MTMATTAEKIGYDHLLDQRVKQLREIEERLERICSDLRICFNHRGMLDAHGLLTDVRRMIQTAQEEYDAF